MAEGYRDLPAGLRLGHNSSALGLDHWSIGRVFQAENLPASVVIPDSAEKARDATPVRRLNQCHQLAEVEG
jgi:hypothetical protein